MISKRTLTRLTALSLAATASACYLPLSTQTSGGGTSPAPAVLPPGQAPAVIPAGNLPAGTPTLKSTQSTIEIGIGEERVLNTILRDGAGNTPTTGVLWISSNANVATVNPTTGQIKGIAPGTVVLTASLQAAPSAQAQIEVKIVEKHVVKLITVEPQTPTMAVDDTLKLTASVQMADGTINGNVKWSSSDDTIAFVNPTTGEVTAKKEGRVTIVAAYGPDSKFQGVADVRIVKDKSLVPTPAPSTVTFGPGATPAPTGTSAPGGGTTGTGTVGAGGRFVFQTSPTTNHLRGVGFLDANTGWAVGDQGTMLKTTNGGVKWEIVSPGSMLNQQLKDVHFSSATNGLVLANTQLHRTLDGGETWNVYNLENGGGIFSGMYFETPTHGYIFAYGQQHYFETKDGGANWEKVQIPQESPVNLAVAGSNRVIHGGSGLFRYDSELGGFSKTQTLGGGNDPYGKGLASNGSAFFYMSPSGLLKSTNGGQSWVNTGELKSGSGGALSFSVSSPNGFFFTDANSGWYYASVVVTTRDGGATWAIVDELNGKSLLDHAFVDAKTGWFVGVGGTIVRYAGN